MHKTYHARPSMFLRPLIVTLLTSAVAYFVVGIVTYQQLSAIAAALLVFLLVGGGVYRFCVPAFRCKVELTESSLNFSDPDGCKVIPLEGTVFSPSLLDRSNYSLYVDNSAQHLYQEQLNLNFLSRRDFLKLMADLKVQKPAFMSESLENYFR